MSDSARASSSAENREIAFFGRITASVTHELNNVIAIIDQNSGLLSDLIAGEERGIPISTERLRAVAAAIQKQTRRGLGIIERLNRYAHTTDHPAAEYELNEVVGNLVELSRRLVQRKKMDLDFHPADTPVKTIGNPFAFQHAVFGALMLVLEAGESGGKVAVGIRLDDRRPLTYIRFEGDPGALPGGPGGVEVLAGIAQCDAQVEKDGDDSVITLRLPAR